MTAIFSCHVQSLLSGCDYNIASHARSLFFVLKHVIHVVLLLFGGYFSILLSIIEQEIEPQVRVGQYSVMGPLS